MIETARSILERCLYIFSFKIRHFREDLLCVESGGKKVQDIGDPNTHSPYTWPSPALSRIDSNAL